jgi:hypothetical protein
MEAFRFQSRMGSPNPFYDCFAILILGRDGQALRSWTDEKRKAQNKVVKMLFVSILAPPRVQKSPLTKASVARYRVGSCKCSGNWRPVRESNPCRRRERAVS